MFLNMKSWSGVFFNGRMALTITLLLPFHIIEDQYIRIIVVLYYVGNKKTKQMARLQYIKDAHYLIQQIKTNDNPTKSHECFQQIFVFKTNKKGF